jgi:hypothetical protein
MIQCVKFLLIWRSKSFERCAHPTFRALSRVIRGSAMKAVLDMRLVSIRFVSVMLSTACFGCHWQSQYLIEAHRIAIHCDTNFFPPPPNSVTQSVDWPSTSAVMPSGMRQPSQGHRGCDFHYRDMKGCARCKDSLGPKKFWRRKARGRLVDAECAGAVGPFQIWAACLPLFSGRSSSQASLRRIIGKRDSVRPSRH